MSRRLFAEGLTQLAITVSFGDYHIRKPARKPACHAFFEVGITEGAIQMALSPAEMGGIMLPLFSQDSVP